MSNRLTLPSYSLAVIAGVLLALSFPRYGHPAVAWVALVPLLVALRGGAAARAVAPGAGTGVRLGLVTGVVAFAGSIYWTREVVQQFGGLPMPLAVVAMLLLALYMAIYAGAAAGATAYLARRMGTAGLLLAPAPWVAGEYLRGWAFGGFPWVPFGSSQATVLPVAQVASLVGVYGLSALVVLLNALLTVALTGRGRTRALAAGAAGVVFATAWGWGTWRLYDSALTREGTPLTVGLVQGNVEQAQKWDPRHAERILEDHIRLTRDVVAKGARYVLWPESSTPFMLEEDPAGQRVHDLARELGVPMLVGSDYVERAPLRLYNAAHLLGPDGRTAAVYRKMHLVPFGEFIPLKGLLYFVAPLVDSLAEFSPGAETVMLPVDGHLTSTSICYEVVYPGLVRDAVLRGSELLTTITNDAWYGRTSAPFQHFELASLRAIEQGRYLARAANTGISGIVDPYGRVRARSALFKQTALVGQVRLLTGRTVYGQIGDVVAWAACALTVMALIVARRHAA
ncbi:MAG: apolipoprotein N-acyltransferase [Vicinamibacterales bacterium]|nr:apolipoprotein N-acyltransferase [Vicinamibacterales bacterium]